MNKQSFQFSSASVSYYFNADFNQLEQIASREKTIILTDENIFNRHKKSFKGWKTIVIKAGEAHKNQATVDAVIDQLIELGADRKSMIIGVGGGVVTDIAGYVSGIYMRGIAFALVPTSILGMVDAAIGGKNGVDVGIYKNLVGLIRQPQFLLFDFAFLKTLPKQEWINGFAEIIKHACIKDAAMFALLEANNLAGFMADKEALIKLIRKNVLLKTKVVMADEMENGDRKFLNFGHSFGHAIENLYQIPHGHAISIGMGVACGFSAILSGFKQTKAVKALLKKYGLPPDFDFDRNEAMRILTKDKKKDSNSINYIVLERIGKARTVVLSFDEIHDIVNRL